MQNEYLEKVSALVKNKRAKTQILTELEAHIADKTDYYRDIGYDEQEAEKRVLDEMGDPEEAALSLNSLHREKWYKIPFNIITVLVLTAIAAIMLIMPQKFAYCDTYYNVPHNVLCDLLSLGIFSAYVVLLILARRYKSKFTPVIVVIFLVAQIIVSLVTVAFAYNFGSAQSEDLLTDWLFSLSIENIHRNRVFTSVFRPFLYGIFALFTKGPSGYIDSLFGYAYVRDSYSIPFTVGTILIYTLLIVWSVFTFIVVFRGERMRKTKSLNKALWLSSKITAVFTAACIAVTAVSTAVAYSAIDYKISENQLVREQMIDCVVNADLGRPYYEMVDKMKTLKLGSEPNERYRADFSNYYGRNVINTETFGYCKDNNFIEVNRNVGDNNIFSVAYGITTFDTYSPLNKYLYIKRADLKEFRDCMSENPTTYEEFLESGWQNYAASIYITENSKDFIFLRDPETPDYRDPQSSEYIGEILRISFDDKDLMDINTATRDDFWDIDTDWYEEENDENSGGLEDSYVDIKQLIKDNNW